MNKEEAIKEYQCPGCIDGPYEECFVKKAFSIACAKHVAGTNIFL